MNAVLERDQSTVSQYRPSLRQANTSPSIAEALWARKAEKAADWAVDCIKPVCLYEADWDGYGGLAPTVDAIKYAAIHLCMLRLYGHIKEAPEVSPLAHGGVCLEWRNGDRELATEIDPAGGAQFLYKGASEPHRKHQRFLATGGIPTALVTSIKLLYP